MADIEKRKIAATIMITAAPTTAIALSLVEGFLSRSHFSSISTYLLTPGSRAGLKPRSGGKSVAVQPIVS
ncbi:hypothetical protein [Marinobacter sp. CHS3-4]|uniref:hypothetical protein n=1 Tax=Marinobacter sp. CHS3-4 TaxID=3045174 RepID=UPI0024B488D6|nr:hypothetical protein [Marinobacter sp. CHS3-4]MDI9246939.1 hypothetical protein [Marinobacter sp. CHS3-4]